jgi:hypothetical protein
MDVHYLRLHGAQLAGANFEGGSLRGADLTGADLRGCALSEVDASYAILRNADLRKAFSRSGQFVGADLRGADLRGSMLIGCGLNQTRLQGADLRGALTWGCGVWDIERDDATQEEGLLIGWEFLDPIDATLHPEFRPSGPQFRVDRLEVAHFLALVRSQPNQLAHIIDAASRHIVLLLGRFTGAQQQTLEELRRALPEYGFAPVVFDFEPPGGRDIVESVATLAGLAHFIIADLSQPRSTPLEAQLIVPTLAVPYVPIIRAGERPFSMFAALQRKYPWVLPTVTYRSEKDLTRKLQKQVIEPARHRSAWLRSKKNVVAALTIPAR